MNPHRDREEQASDTADADALAPLFPHLVAALHRASARFDAYLFPHGRELSDAEALGLALAFEDLYCIRAELGLAP